MIYPPMTKAAKLGEMLSGLGEVVEKEHRRLLAWKSIIEKRKEDQERLLLEKEREEESKRLKQQKITEEAEQRRLAAEFEQRKNQRILREIEERELEEAQALLEEAQKGVKKKGKKQNFEGEKITKQTVMELALSEQLRERQEMEKKLQKLAKTMDHFERAKREESAPVMQAAFEQQLAADAALHEQEQQQEVELSKQRHTGDVLREEEEARKHEEMERRKKEEAERKAKLDEMAERQRQRELELEEKERKRKEELLGQ